MEYNVAIIGAGLIGRKRAVALRRVGGCRLIIVADIDRNAARNLAREFGAEAETDWQRVVRRDDIDIVVVSTFNKFLAPISLAALKNGKHVLCEKPLGRCATESKKLVEAARESKVILKAGFNHRHHPAISYAKKLLDKGKIGRLLFLRCRYGHGGRPGYQNEWRADKELCGGGELLDQGVHVVDLFRWFAGDFRKVFGSVVTSFWQMKVEDNAFAIFKNKSGVVANMHTSWTQWKNLFSFEVFGSKGYLVIEGLGRSYGRETLKIGIRNAKGKPPHEKIIEFSGEDISWQKEWGEFISAIKKKKEPIGSGWDGYQANIMIEAVYKSAKSNKVVNINH